MCSFESRKISPVCPTQSGFVSPACRRHLISHLSFFFQPLFFTVASGVHSIARNCISLWPRRVPVPLFPHIRLNLFCCFHTHRSSNILFTAYSAFEDGVRFGARKGRRGLLSCPSFFATGTILPSFRVLAWAELARRGRGLNSGPAVCG